MTTAPMTVDEARVAPPSPEAILTLGTAFWASKALLTAAELGLFSELATSGPLDADALRARLDLHQRGARDFFDALVALGMLEREGGRYRNTAATELFLDQAKPRYVGGILEMASTRLFGHWSSLTEALRTGQPQSEAKTGAGFFDALYADHDKSSAFVRAMTSVSLGPAHVLAASFPWDRYRTVIDIGGAEGCVPVQLALAHGHLRGGVFDLPGVRPFFDDYVTAAGLGDRLQFLAGDFFVDELPTADVLIMGQILHDWGMAEKRLLLEKAQHVLAEGGRLIVYDSIIDDARCENAAGLLMSLNMLIETPEGFDYTGAECQQWMHDVGFRDTYVQHLVGPVSMVVGTK